MYLLNCVKAFASRECRNTTEDHKLFNIEACLLDIGAKEVRDINGLHLGGSITRRVSLDGYASSQPRYKLYLDLGL